MARVCGGRGVYGEVVVTSFDKLKAAGIIAEGDVLPGLGHNNPPPEPTQFEVVKTEIEDLYDEAKTWLDGQPIANAGQASEIGELRKRIQAAAKRAEAQRVTDKKPHDDAAAAVQALYNPLIQKGKGKTEMALGALNQALAPWLAELDRQQREAARIEQQRAAAAAEAAHEASRAAAASANLFEREEADRLQEAAKDAAKIARAAEQAKPQVHASGGGRAVGMKSVWTPDLVDPTAAIEHYRKVQPAALKDFMIEQARKDVRAGSRHIPGFTINETKVPA